MEINHQILDSVAQAVKASGQSPCELKFFVKREILSRALTHLVKATSLRYSTLPSLANILMVAGPSAQVIMASANLSTGVMLQLEEAEVEREGAFTVPAKTLLSLAKAFPKGSRLSIEVQERQVVVTCGSLTCSLQGGLEAREFPNLWSGMEGLSTHCVIESRVLCQAIKEVHYIADAKDGRSVFTTICLALTAHQIDLITAGSFRIAKRMISSDVTDGGEGTVLVPVDAMRLLVEVMPPDVEVTLVWDKAQSRIMFQAGQVCLVSRLVEDAFPNIAQAIPTSHATVFSLDRLDLLQICKAYKPFCQSNCNVLKLSYRTSGEVEFGARSESLGRASRTIETPVSGFDGEILLDWRLLIDALENMCASALTVKIENARRPVVIVPTERDDFLFVLMPMMDNDGKF